MKKRNLIKPPAFISHWFLTMNTVKTAASLSCHHAFPILMDCIPLSLSQSKPFLLQDAYCQVFGKINVKNINIHISKRDHIFG